MYDQDWFVAEYDPAEFFGRPQLPGPFSKFAVITILVFLVVLGRLVDLQIVQGARNFFLAEGNRVREVVSKAPRGVLLDRDGEPLLSNVVRYALAIIPADLPRDQGARAAILTKIRDEIKMKHEELQVKISEADPASFNPVLLVDQLKREDSIRLELLFAETPGVVVLKEPTRAYQAAGFAHVIGLIGKISPEELARRPDYKITDWIGVSGLEQVYEERLRGKDGGTQVEVNAKGQVVRLIGEVAPERGEDLQLTIDKQVQADGMEALGKVAAKGGALVAINPKTGGLLALGSLPEFDPNIFLSGSKEKIDKIFNDERRPMINRAIGAAFPSGSTIKPLWATAALADGTINQATKLDTSAGAIRIGDFTFEDWRTHGVADVKQAIAESNNIFFYALAGGYQQINGLGPARLHSWAKRFGLGDKNGIDLPAEAAGFVPSEAWKKKTTGERWYVGDSYNLGIGQGNLLVSPLQLARALGGIATGKLAKPYLLKSGQPELKDLGIKPEVLKIVRQGMRQAVVSGSARQLSDLKDKDGNLLEAAAKTGTAQAGKQGVTHGWMAAFAPVDDPEILVVAFVEEGGEGHATAGPVVKQVIERYFNRTP